MREGGDGDDDYACCYSWRVCWRRVGLVLTPSWQECGQLTSFSKGRKGWGGGRRKVVACSLSSDGSGASFLVYADAFHLVHLVAACNQLAPLGLRRAMLTLPVPACTCKHPQVTSASCLTQLAAASWASSTLPGQAMPCCSTACTPTTA